jgi:uncharacterized membrane protein YoaK (UPF0700 family)
MASGKAFEWKDNRPIMAFAHSRLLPLLGELCSGHSGCDFWVARRHHVGVTVTRTGGSLEDFSHNANGPMTSPHPTSIASGTRRAPGDASLLSFVAAFVDTCGFVGLFQLFTAHVTGNFVLMGAAIVNRQGAVWAKLLAFPVFILAVVFTVWAADALQRRGRSRVGPLLWVEAALLTTAALLPFAIGSPQEADDVRALSVGLTMVLAMGLQNALMRLDLVALPPTTVMTGNVTQFTIDAWALWRVCGAPREVARDRLRRMAGPIVAFLLGAAGGAAGYAVLGFTSLLLPTVICAVVARRYPHQ